VEAAGATHQWHLHGLAAACRAAVAVGRGLVGDGERHAMEAVQSFRRSDYYWAGAVGFPQLAAARALRGDPVGARAGLAEWADQGGDVFARSAIRVELLCVDHVELMHLLDGHP